MKKLRLLAAILLFAAAFIMMAGPAKAEDTIPSSAFEDEKFYKFVLKEYDTNGDGALQRSEAEAAASLFAHLYGDDMYTGSFDSIKGIENFPNLWQVHLGGMVNLKDLTPLAVLGKLTDLSISDTEQVADYSFLNSLTSLTNLSLVWTNIPDITFLKNCRNIERFTICGGNVTDFSPLSYMEKIEVLDIASNENIVSLEPLRGLTSLREIRLSNLNVMDYSMLASFPKLEKFELFNLNADVDFNWIGGMGALKFIKIGASSAVIDLDLVKNLKNLEVLSLQLCKNVRNFSALEGRTGIKELYIAGVSSGQTDSIDLSFLSGMTGLERLELSRNSLTVLPDLSKLVKLQDLWLDDNYLSYTEAEAASKLPSSITSQSGWYANIGMDKQNAANSSEGQTTENEGETDGSNAGSSGGNNGSGSTGSSGGNAGASGGNNGGEAGSNGGSGTETNNGGNSNNGASAGSDETTSHNEDDATTSAAGAVTFEDGNRYIETADGMSGGGVVAVYGKLSDDIMLEARRLEDLSEYYDMLELVRARADGREIVHMPVYDIWLYKNMQVGGRTVKLKVQPEGRIRVMIKLPENQRTGGAGYRVFRREEDGTITELETEYRDGIVSFYSDHFSIFTVIITRLFEGETTAALTGRPDRDDNVLELLLSSEPTEGEESAGGSETEEGGETSEDKSYEKVKDIDDKDNDDNRDDNDNENNPEDERTGSSVGRPVVIAIAAGMAIGLAVAGAYELGMRKNTGKSSLEGGKK